MEDKDESGKSNKPRKKAQPQGNPQPENHTKHPDQQRAEQEEKHTRREEEASGESEAPDPGEPEHPAGETGDQEAPEAEEPAAGAMEGGRFPVVGIGASAGGLEALESLFDAVPQDCDMAFVVVTHTHPENHSMLPELIRRKSKIPVNVIEDGMALEPGAAYLPPSDRDPVLEGGVFSLRARPGKSEMHMPVDLFLKYLAEAYGERAAGVILSGTGTDGTQGIRTIKEKAGLAVAQSPDSARHRGMPQSAIETGLVDYVLAAPEIPRRLIEYFKHPADMRFEIGKKGAKEPEPLRRILAFLASRTRHDFSFYKENTLIRRIERRMTVNRSRNALDYLDLLHREPEELRLLFQDLLIGVTSFFRDPEAFEMLRKEVLPGLVSRSENEALRVWIPGCATGEEAYSVAILFLECLQEEDSPRELQVFGTDIDARAIEKARHGTYVQNIVSDVSPERLKRFFTKEDSRFRLKSDIRERVVFAEQNVLADPPFSNLDLLVCRNLLIYLKPEAQKRLIPLFHYALKEDGVLFLGSSEGVGRHSDLFEPLIKQHSIYRKKNHVVHPEVRFPTGRRLEGVAGEPKAEEKPEARHISRGRAVEKVLMRDHTPPCVLINRRGEILYYHGRTGKYLEPAPGDASLQIGDMVREGLRFPILSAMHRIDRDHQEIREKRVRVKTNHEYQQIDLMVKGFSEPPLKDCLLVVFEAPSESSPLNLQPEDSAEGRDGRIAVELEEELMRVRQDYRSAMEELQSSNEELRSSNEELHSSNEELQSTNEELESSREELQSLNEELNTVNSELNSKMSELRDAYKAINSVLNSTRIAIVFLDTGLRLRRFTPEATQLLNIIESDLGRPLKHIAHNLEYDNLSEKASQVLETLTPFDEEIRSKDGSWYRIRVMLYRPEEHTIEGVVLTFINIDAQKASQKDLEEMKADSDRFAECIGDMVRECLLVLDSRFRVVRANRRFYDTFRTTARDTEGKRVFDLGDGRWAFPGLRERIEDVLAHDGSFEGRLVAHRFPDVGFKRMRLTARTVGADRENRRRIVLAMEDVTEVPAGSGKGTP